MIKELQRKLIKLTMLIVTVLLAVFLTAVNAVNFTLSRRESSSTLSRIVSENLMQIPGMDGGAPGEPRPSGNQMSGLQETAGGDRGLGIYFVARVNADGAVLFSDLTHSGGLEWEEMVSLLNDAGAALGVSVTCETETEMAPPEWQGQEGIEDMEGPPKIPSAEMNDRSGERHITGKTGNYMYYALQEPDQSAAFAFLDIGRETASLIRIMLVTAVIGMIAWIFVLLLMIYLSGRAIAPIAENIKRQRQFITDAGHELKTPLAVIVSNVDVQELHGGHTKWLDNIRSQALRLSDLTNQMLMLAKMEETDTATFVSTTFDASALLEDTVRVFQESASLRGIEIRTQIEDGVMLHFSREQYQQMLELLLDNAVKYAKEDGFIAVSLSVERRSMLHLSCSNNCEQLPDIDPSQLFDRFYRADVSRSRHTGGSGIGLAVVRAIAEGGGGSVKAYFHPDNVIEFTVDLPRG